MHVAASRARHLERAGAARLVGERVQRLTGRLVDGVGLVGVLFRGRARRICFGAELGDAFVADLLTELVL